MSQAMGAKISELRKGKGLTQAQLAEQVAVTDKGYNFWYFEAKTCLKRCGSSIKCWRN